MARVSKVGLIGHILLTIFTGGLWLVGLVIYHITKK
jgi:hypothetical protein